MTEVDKDYLERKARLVMLAYRVLYKTDLPPDDISDKDVLLAIASEAVKMAAETVVDVPDPDQSSSSFITRPPHEK